MKFKSAMLKLAAVASLAAAVSACTTPSSVSQQGTTDKPVWPKWDSVTFDNSRGTFPTPEALRQIKSGVTKDQLYQLIGRPHYDEVWRPREWNYLFHFHTPGIGTDGVTTCQFKILFDDKKFARSFYWNPIDPIDAACPAVLMKVPENPTPVVVPATPVTPAKAYGLQRYTLSADALFKFDKYRVEDMNPKGRAELDELAEKLKSFDQLNGVLVVGHTDLLGTDEYNMVLSRNRADTVSRYLIQRGVPAGILRSYGAGEREPVKHCENNGNREEHIKCLHPNRRVEVTVDGSGVLLNDTKTEHLEIQQVPVMPVMQQQLPPPMQQ